MKIALKYSYWQSREIVFVGHLALMGLLRRTKRLRSDYVHRIPECPEEVSSRCGRWWEVEAYSCEASAAAANKGNDESGPRSVVERGQKDGAEKERIGERERDRGKKGIFFPRGKENVVGSEI